MANRITGTKVNTTAKRASFIKEVKPLISRSKSSYAHALVKKIIFAKSAPNCKNSRKTETPLKEVGVSYWRSVYYQIPFFCHPKQEKLPRKTNFNSSIAKDRESLDEGCNRKSFFSVSRREEVFEQHILSKGKRWGQQACHQLEKTKPIYPIHSFQNRNPTIKIDITEKDGFMCSLDDIFAFRCWRTQGDMLGFTGKAIFISLTDCSKYQ